MDIQLLILDGYEATRGIKRDPELKDIPSSPSLPMRLSDEESARGRLRRLHRQTLQHSPTASENRSIPRTASLSVGIVRDPPRILIVDDNENNCGDPLPRASALKGYATAEACDGARGLGVRRQCDWISRSTSRCQGWTALERAGC